MPSFRRPKGVYARPTLDWFSDQVCTGGAEIQNDPIVNNGLFWRISLFNNDLRGRKCYVYQITLASDFAVFYYGSLHHGSLGDFFASCFSVDSSLPVPPGQIFTLTGPSFAAPPYPAPPTDPYVTFPASAASGSVSHSGPLFIISGGDSLVVSSNSSVNQLAVSFWYVPIQGN